MRRSKKLTQLRIASKNTLGRREWNAFFLVFLSLPITIPLMDDREKAKSLRAEILEKVREYALLKWPKKKFDPKGDAVPVSGRVYDGDDVATLVDSSLDFWLTTGRFALQFEKNFAEKIGAKHCLLVNSGSSANLLALSALTSPLLKERQLKPGDEVITVAAGFPTTVNPIYQNNLIPVFIDVTLPTYTVDIDQLEAAYSPKVRAIMMAHTLGNPFDLDAVMAFAKKHHLFVIEDNCDALGTTYNGKMTGSFGDLSTYSFYPAHHITMGEGGAVVTSDDAIKRAAESFRDWGRDCYCAPGAQNTCCKRFAWQLGDLPFGYDHKYIYSHVGYNLKATDMQAAVGCAQLKKLDSFIAKRKENFTSLYNLLKPLEEFLILPEAQVKSDPSWFGFPITLRENAPITRHELVQHLENHRIATRQLFAGNLVKQPAYKNLPCRIIGDLKNSDIVMERTFWIGVYPGIDREMCEYVAEVMGEAFTKKPGRIQL